jgi:hypothetical protein
MVMCGVQKLGGSSTTSEGMERLLTGLVASMVTVAVVVTNTTCGGEVMHEGAPADGLMPPDGLMPVGGGT